MLLLTADYIRAATIELLSQFDASTCVTLFKIMTTTIRHPRQHFSFFLPYIVLYSIESNVALKILAQIFNNQILRKETDRHYIELLDINNNNRKKEKKKMVAVVLVLLAVVPPLYIFLFPA